MSPPTPANPANPATAVTPARPAASANAPCRLAIVALALLFALPALVGCEPVGYVAHGLFGGAKSREVEARYRELEGRSVAVVVSADSYLMYAYPQARSAITRVASRQIHQHVENARVKSPYEVIEYQRTNGHWHALPYSQLLADMNVERVVLIDLLEYRTREPGNPHLYQGVATGNVLVIAADSDDPDNADFEDVVQVEFPEHASKVGTLADHIDHDTVQAGLVQMFSRQVARLFHDHRIDP